MAQHTSATTSRRQRWRDHLGAMTGAEPVLAGSGGTWFVHGAHEVELDGITSVIARTR